MPRRKKKNETTLDSERPKKKMKVSASKVAEFLQAIEEPLHYSPDKITSEQEAEEKRKADATVTMLMKDDFDLDADISVKSHKKKNSQKIISGSVLHLATIFLRKYYLEALLDHGADVNKTNDEGLTPIQVLLLSPHKAWTVHCVHLLIERDANLDVVDEFGRNLLDLCLISSKQNGEIIKLLMKHGIQSSKDHLPSPLEIARRALKNNQYLSLISEIDKKQLNEVDENKRTFLHHLALSGKDLTVLPNKKLNSDAVDILGRTPLHYALLTGKKENIKILYKTSKWGSEQKLNYLDLQGNNFFHFLMFGFFSKVYKGNKLCNFTQLCMLFSSLLSIFKNEEISQLILKENSSQEIPTEFVLKLIKLTESAALCDEFKFPTVSHKKFFGNRMLWEGNTNLDAYFYHFVFNLYKLVPIEYSEMILNGLLIRLYQKQTNILNEFLMPTKTVLKMGYFYDFPNVYTAGRILRVLPSLQSSIKNAVLFQTFVIKTLSNNTDYTNRFGPLIVYHLLKDVINSLDLASIIATFLDNYTLNLVLPKVRKNCHVLSSNFINGNNVPVLRSEGDKNLIGQDANNFLWNQYCQTFFPPDNVTSTPEFNLEDYKQTIFHKIIFYLECRGIDPDFSYKKLEKMCKQYTFHEINKLLNFKESEAVFTRISNEYKNENLKPKQNDILNENKDLNVVKDELLDYWLSSIDEETSKEAPNTSEVCLSDHFHEEQGDNETSVSIMTTQNWLNSPILTAPPRLLQTSFDNEKESVNSQDSFENRK